MCKKVKFSSPRTYFIILRSDLAEQSAKTSKACRCSTQHWTLCYGAGEVKSSSVDRGRAPILTHLATRKIQPTHTTFIAASSSALQAPSRYRSFLLLSLILNDSSSCPRLRQSVLLDARYNTTYEILLPRCVEPTARHPSWRHVLPCTIQDEPL